MKMWINVLTLLATELDFTDAWQFVCKELMLTSMAQWLNSSSRTTKSNLYCSGFRVVQSRNMSRGGCHTNWPAEVVDVPSQYNNGRLLLLPSLHTACLRYNQKAGPVVDYIRKYTFLGDCQCQSGPFWHFAGFLRFDVYCGVRDCVHCNTLAR